MQPNVSPQIITTHAKTILSGEHTVLRGGIAVVVPLPHQTLSLQFVADDIPLSISCQGIHAPPALAVFFRGLIDACCDHLAINPNTLRGQIILHNTIAMGIGFGFSAAACALVSKWFAALGHLPTENIFACAHKLEHPFHSQSSGCDVMGALQETPFIYQMDAPVQPLTLAWQPHLYLSHCGEHAATHTCVEKVQRLQSQDPQKAAALDQRMQQATDDVITALQTTQYNRRDTLQCAITCAADCFEAWQLTSPTLTAHMQQLTQHGALACKPTGAGGGGLVLSLWATPPTHQAIAMIPVFSKAHTASTS